MLPYYTLIIIEIEDNDMALFQSISDEKRFFLNKKRYRIESIVKYGGVEIKNEGIVDGRGDRCEGFEFNFSVILLSDMHFSVL